MSPPSSPPPTTAAAPAACAATSACPRPGDVRHCLSALAEDESLVGQLFEHRFTSGELAGHSFGNLFLAGLTDLLGSFDQAVSESARVLAVVGRVVPSTTDMVELVAEMEDGRTVRGETAIAADGSSIRTVRPRPARPARPPARAAAIERAELIVMGPGSLFTSTLPPLLVPGIREAVRAARVPRIYVCNLLQQPGETEGYRASDHVARIYEHVGDDLVDAVLVSRNRAEHGVPGAGRPGRSATAGRARVRRPAGRRVAARPRPAGAHARAARRAGTAMSFSEDVRHELVERAARQGVLPHGAAVRPDPPAPAACRCAAGGELAVVAELADPAAARLAFTLIRERGADCEILSFREHRFEQPQPRAAAHRRRHAACSCCTRRACCPPR